MAFPKFQIQFLVLVEIISPKKNPNLLGKLIPINVNYFYTHIILYPYYFYTYIIIKVSIIIYTPII